MEFLNALDVGKVETCDRLQEKLGLRIPGVESRSDWSNKDQKVEPLPDIDALHEALLSDEAAMNYLTNVRGFSLEIIKKQKLGYTPNRYFRELGAEVKADCLSVSSAR